MRGRKSEKINIFNGAELDYDDGLGLGAGQSRF